MNEQKLSPPAREEIKRPKTGFNKFLKVYFIISVVVIAVLSVGFTMKLHDFKEHGPFGIIMEKIVKELDLSDTQKKEIDKIRDEVKAKMDEKKSNREKDMEGFGNMFKQDKMDKEKMMEMVKQHEAEREEMKSFFMDELIKVHDILTPEQRTKAVEKMKELKEKFREHKDKQHPKDKLWENQ